jgi:hypothetical protein
VSADEIGKIDDSVGKTDMSRGSLLFLFPSGKIVSESLASIFPANFFLDWNPVKKIVQNATVGGVISHIKIPYYLNVPQNPMISTGIMSLQMKR